jgi:hypothetical protein
LKSQFLGAIVATILASASAAAQAEDLTFVLTNESSYAVTSFFTSPADIDNWEEDIFAGNYLPAGNQVNVTVGDGREQCLYDMKFVLENETEFVEKGIDLCALDEYTLSDSQ